MTNPFAKFTGEVTEVAERLTKEQETPVVPVRGTIKDGQIKYLTDLRIRFGISTDDVLSLSTQQAYEEISELSKRPAPASASQLEKINTIIGELTTAGMRINISQEKMSTLTGGKDGTASQLITFLLSKRQEAGVTSPASTAQIDTIASWFLCPDIPFENLEITKKVSMPDISPTAWRLMTPEEFVAELTAKLNREQASKFIDDNRASYYQWKKTRITDSQVKYIRQLDERMANIESQAEVTFAVDMEGNLVEVSTAKKNTYNPRAHEPLTDIQIGQLSYQEASTLIDQMKSELSERRSSISTDDSQQTLEDKVHAFSERTGTGIAKTENDARSREYAKLTDLIFKLEAVVGQENPELHDMIQEVLIHDTGCADSVAQEIKSFMHLAVDRQDKARAYRTAGALLQIAEETEVGSSIAEMVNSEVQEEYAV